MQTVAFGDRLHECQILFIGKNKKNIINVSANFALSMLSVNRLPICIKNQTKFEAVSVAVTFINQGPVFQNLTTLLVHMTLKFLS